MSANGFTRRDVLAAGAAAGVFAIVPRHVLGGAGFTAPSDKLNIAGIGIGGMGANNLGECEAENIIALCDVDHAYAAKTFDRYPQAKRFRDFREMLREVPEIDAVIIATADHTHAVITTTVMRAGKHVYCQKPLTHSIREARAVAAAAAKTDVVTQMGIQGHSQEGMRLVCEWIWDGAIGEVTEIDAWCSDNYDPPGHAWWSTPLKNRPAAGEALPGSLDWDSWLGPAAERPYHSCYHPGKWRRWWDFGCGWMGDRGVHTLDVVKWAMKLDHPTSVLATGVSGGTGDVHPALAVVTFKFPAREGFPPLKLTWYEGQQPPKPKEMEEGREFPNEGGVLFKGTKGVLMCGVYADSPRLVPETLMASYKRPPQSIPRVEGTHVHNWIRACKGMEETTAPFSYSGPLTEFVLLGNAAKRFPDWELAWDGKAMRVPNHAGANAWLEDHYRTGWSLEA